ncbi:DUF2206 domain-containing protein [Methanobacterium sp.]|uniref:DUF2206 domain-containing protein n=1 Tax=Methanobacterium sp. TaxID=2164 RepID=UPI003C75670E
MLLNNPLQMNDWKFSWFIKLVIFIQVLMLVVMGLDLKNITIPIISPLIVFFYLTFIPGYLLLRILKIHEMGSVTSLLYAVGLSILSVMLLGFSANTLLPFIGISNPISFIPLAIIVNVYIILLAILSYFRDKDFNSPSLIDTEVIFSPVFLFLCLIPFIAIFGSYAMNLSNNNIITMILLALIAIIFVLVIFDRIPKKLYLFTVWIISISLIYMSSLISPYVWGWDIQNEYYLANLVLTYSHWNYMLPDAYNSMLSIVMLGPVYSILTHIDLDYVLKIIIPFLFSLLPLGLYRIFKIQTQDSKISFMAVFLFISFNTFYIELLSLTREMTAELFLICILLLFFERKFKPNLILLMILFSMGLVFSHYSTAYFFIAALIVITLILGFFNLINFNESLKKIDLKKDKTLLYLLPLITIFTALFSYLWYSTTSQGLAINSIIDVTIYIYQDFRDALNLTIQNIGLVPGPVIYTIIAALIIIFLLIIFYLAKMALKRFIVVEHRLAGTLESNVKKYLNNKIISIISIFVLLVLLIFLGGYKTWVVSFLRYFNFLVVYLCFMGLILVFFKIYIKRFQNIFLAFAVFSMIVLMAGYLEPSFESAFNISRIYELSFLFLSPVCVIGGIKVFGSIYQVLTRKKITGEGALKMFSVFLLVFMLFNTGFISVFADQSIPMHLSNQDRLSDYYPLFDYEEFTGAQWLTENNVSKNIYADVYGKFIFYRFTPNMYNISANNGISEFTNYTSPNTYMYLRKLNTENGFLIGYTSGSNRNRIYADLSSNANMKNRIFDDGDSVVYYS